MFRVCSFLLLHVSFFPIERVLIEHVIIDTTRTVVWKLLQKEPPSSSSCR